MMDRVELGRFGIRSLLRNEDMKYMNITLSVTAALLVNGFVVAGNSGGQGDIEMTLDSMPSYELSSLGLDRRNSWDQSGGVNFTSSTIKAGERVWTNQYGREMITYCIQVFESASVGDTITFSQTTDLTTVPEAPPSPGPMAGFQVNLVQDLYSRFIDKKTGEIASGTSLDEFDYSVASSAFQLVLWEIVHENFDASSVDEAGDQLSLDTGAFQANSGDESVLAASTIIGELGEDGWGSIGDKLVGLSSPSMQDQLTVVPLPTPVLLAGIGLLGAGLVRRRMK
jgi:hypothetical protein